MSYWSMSAESSLSVLERKRDGRTVDISSHAQQVETEANEDFVVEATTTQLLNLIEDLGDLSQDTLTAFEAKGCEIVHRNMINLPPKTLLDPGFWRWLAIDPAYSVVAWRFPSLHPNNFGASSSSFKRCLPYKLFLHGKISYDVDSDDPYARAWIGGEDFWDSQLIAVDNGYFESLSIGILDEMRERAATNSLARKAVRRVNRRRANQLPDILTLSEGRAIVSQEFDEASSEEAEGQ